jgi:uncharacterized membrane protein YeaQ/YmgE (transglycosylase-associated protein family)
MGLLEFFLFLLIAAICGLIGQSIAGYTLGGCFISIIVGFIGALIGEWLADKMDLPYIFTIHIAGRNLPIIWTIIGATVFTIIIGLLTKGIRGEKR